MRQLSEDEIAQEGDWFYIFVDNIWIRLDERPKPLFRQTIGELERENDVPHFPIIIMRPNHHEYLFRIWPKTKPKGKKRIVT